LVAVQLGDIISARAFEKEAELKATSVDYDLDKLLAQAKERP
jgi:hypothetical protein